ncbi:MAG: GTPase HflX [Xanthomonadaceae bacterium]|nr:GTPase HflX [Xanthomonadaceae bacterium]
MFERSRRGERALLIQPFTAGHSDPSSLEEFAELARSAGATVVGSVPARIDRANPATLIGSGKVEEALSLCNAVDADLVLVNHTLSPVQERNLERVLQRRVVDRTGLILDIFAQRARSHEGKLQVELAQLRHMATRLVRGWTHLERQRGGSIGLRGPGETQLETDRRLLAKRVDALQARLAKVEVQRTQMRRARVRQGVARVALVGYTNAGKSTLFNALTGADAYEADQLFATLDPTVRRLDLPGGEVVLADTVGFVRDLPHDLVAAFRSTLSEARDAQLLLHVVDASDPARDERIGQVDEVLREIGAGDIPQLVVFNKIDRLDDASARVDLDEDGAATRAWVSARTGSGLGGLRDAIASRLARERVSGRIHLPSTAGRLRARLFAAGAVQSEETCDDGWRIDLDMPLDAARQLVADADAEAAALRDLLPMDDRA